MFKFKEYTNLNNVLLLESNDEKVKLHLSHLEDLAIEQGKQGFANFEEQVTNLVNFLHGLSSNTKLNAKIDGSPSLYFGEDPREEHKGKFFVATKSAFSIGNPKINHSEEEIVSNYGDSAVGQILKSCLGAFSKCYDHSGLIYQGDLLFSLPNDKKLTTIDGVQYITFKPNTLVYAVPVDAKSELYQQITAAGVGIVLHDSFYSIVVNKNAVSTKPAGKNFEKIKMLGKQNNIFIDDSTHQSVNIIVSTESRVKISRLLQQSKEYMQEISQDFDNNWKASPLLGLLKIYLNYQVRTDGGIFKKALKNEEFNSHSFKNDFKKWLDKKFQDESTQKLTDKGKISTLARRDSLFSWIDANITEFNYLLHVTYNMLLIKNELLKIVSEVGDKLGKVFYQQPDGTFIAGKGEGYVIFVGNNQAKLVDRMAFSAINFKKKDANV